MNVAIIGYGGVGKAFVALLEKQTELLEKENLHINIRYIIGRNGDIYNNEISVCDAAADPALDLAVILTPTNKDSGQPGLNYARAFLSAGKHVVTADKGLVIHGYHELKQLAKEKGVQFTIGCTTGGALPSINSGIMDMAGSEIYSIEGILNGTSNYILQQMEDCGCTYKEALAAAQKDGIAEANPALDVEGWDTAGKLLILCNVLMHTNKTLDDIEVQGITHLTPEDIKAASEDGCKYKLVGRAVKQDKDIQLTVKAEKIPLQHLLYQVDGKNKAVRYVSDTLGELVIMGGASGTTPAAASVLRDIVNIHRGYQF